MTTDYTGTRFTRLVVIASAERNRHGQAMWRVRCDCGVEKICGQQELRSGHTKSCGCLKAELTRQRSSGENHWVSHGHARSGKNSPTYVSWGLMLQRCMNPKNPRWAEWGGRGITVCERWRESFPNFLADMGPRPDERTLDRKDNNGNYEPGNCRWATRKEQIANRCNSLSHLSPGERLAHERARSKAKYQRRKAKFLAVGTTS